MVVFSPTRLLPSLIKLDAFFFSSQQIFWLVNEGKIAPSFMSGAKFGLELGLVFHVISCCCPLNVNTNTLSLTHTHTLDSLLLEGCEEAKTTHLMLSPVTLHSSLLLSCWAQLSACY